MFAGSNGTLILTDPSNFTGTISGLNDDDRIDLANINWVTAQVTSATYSPSTNLTTLVINDGSHTDTIQLVGDYTTSSWTFSSDGAGGAFMVDPVKSLIALDTTEPSSSSETIVATLDAQDVSDVTASVATSTTASISAVSSAAASDPASTHSEAAGDASQLGTGATGYFGRTSTGLLGGMDGSDDSSLAVVRELLDIEPAAAHDHAGNPLLPAWAVKLMSGTMASTATESAPGHVHVSAANIQPSPLRRGRR